jgi:GDPmannose 4,6-dehydratase
VVVREVELTVPKALITGITGQDGSYLAEFLLERDYEVFGLVRSTSLGTFERIEHLLDRINLVEGDMLDEGSLVRALKAIGPDEVYNLAAHSFVQRSFGQPVFTADVTGLGVARILEAIRENAPEVRFYQASSSEMFGNTNESPQNEATLLVPASPYAVSKVFGHLLTQNYRRAYGLFACSGILFNHESPRRGIHFVTRKVTDGAARISLGLAKDLRLGNLDARRDWGYAPDYVRAMWLMLQQDEPDDYVVATGVNHSVRELCDLAFGIVGLDYREHVIVDEANLRPSDVAELRGDATKARATLGWEPTVDFQTVIRSMVEADVARARIRASTNPLMK